MRSERRRHKRFEVDPRSCLLSLIRRAAGEAEYQDCVPLNLGGGGICLRTRDQIPKGERCVLLVDLHGMPRGPAFVRVQIRWVRRSEPDRWEAGAEFLESVQGRLGPVEAPGAGAAAATPVYQLLCPDPLAVEYRGSGSAHHARPIRAWSGVQGSVKIRLDTLLHLVHMAASASDAARILIAGVVKINGVQHRDVELQVEAGESEFLVQVGERRCLVTRPTRSR